jgi:uncharacterized Fe-S center protein
MSKVYWINSRSPNLYQSITAKIDAILGLEEMAEVVVPDRSLAIKINISELGYGHAMPPVVVTTFFEQIRQRGAKALVTDSGSLFRGSRFTGHDWMNTALVQGFGIGEAFDNQLMLAGGFTNEEGRFCASDGEHLGGVELGSLITDVTNLVVLPLAGAVYNLGMGLLTRSGKARVHSCLEL